MAKEKSFLAELREKAGLTQGEVTAKLGLSSAQYLSNVERGKCKLAPKQMKKIAKLYKIGPLVLVNHWIDVKRAELIKKVC